MSTTDCIFLDQPTDCSWSPSCPNEAIITQYNTATRRSVPICEACLLAVEDAKHAGREVNKKAAIVVAAYVIVGLLLCSAAAYRYDGHPIKVSKSNHEFAPPAGERWY
jgi:hypothetical protein